MTELEQAQRAYKIAALLIEKFGNAYLPIFERVHKELQRLEAECDLVKLALKVASENKKPQSATL